MCVTTNPIPRKIYESVEKDPNDRYLIGRRFEVCNEIKTFGWFLDPGKDHLGSLVLFGNEDGQVDDTKVRKQIVNTHNSHLSLSLSPNRAKR